jgi:hypothetical protein
MISDRTGRPYGTLLAARPPVTPPWWQTPIEFSAARYYPDGMVAFCARRPG